MGATRSLGVRTVIASFAIASIAIIAQAPIARADGDPCARGAIHRGPAIDLNVRGADIQDVLAWIADAGRVNIVLADDVRGAITLRLRRVAWQLALCTITRAHQLEVIVDGNVYLVRHAAP